MKRWDSLVEGFVGVCQPQRLDIAKDLWLVLPRRWEGQAVQRVRLFGEQPDRH